MKDFRSRDEFGFLLEVPICIASCYSIVWEKSHRSFNKVRFAKRVDGENQISLRDGGASPTSERAIVILMTSRRMREPHRWGTEFSVVQYSFNLQLNIVF